MRVGSPPGTSRRCGSWSCCRPMWTPSPAPPCAGLREFGYSWTEIADRLGRVPAGGADALRRPDRTARPGPAPGGGRPGRHGRDPRRGVRRPSSRVAAGRDLSRLRLPLSRATSASPTAPPSRRCVRCCTGAAPRTSRRMARLTPDQCDGSAQRQGRARSALACPGVPAPTRWRRVPVPSHPRR